MCFSQRSIHSQQFRKEALFCIITLLIRNEPRAKSSVQYLHFCIETQNTKVNVLNRAKAPRSISIKKYKAGEMPSHQRHDFLQTKIVKFKTLYLHLVYTAVDYSNLAICMSRNLCSFFYTAVQKIEKKNNFCSTWVPTLEICKNFCFLIKWKNSYGLYRSNASEKKWLKNNNID